MKRAAALLILFATIPACAPIEPSGLGFSDNSAISMKWEMYPDPRKEIINPGEEIIFKLTSLTTAQRINKIGMFFGDGTSSEADLSCDSYPSGNKYQCSPVHFAHVYKEDNFYRPYVKCDYGIYPSDSGKKETAFIIAPHVATDEQFKELAFIDSVRQLQSGIMEVLGGRTPAQFKFALTSFKNANFEYGKTEDDIRDIAVVKKLTTALVNDGYSILEKNPQALIRLAHESIVKKDSSGRASDQYQDSLEYGLRTEYNDPSQPFVYGAEIEGAKSSDKEHLSHQRKSSDGLFGKMVSSMNTGSDESKSASKRESSETDKQALETYSRNQDRSLYFAKFSTADYVITIDRNIDQKEDITLSKSKPVYYDIKFETEMVERVARTEYAARILERNGNIVWVKNIVGQAQDRVIPDFVKASQQKQQGVTLGDLFKNIIGD